MTPFCSERCTTNSYDLELGRRVIRYTSDVLDPRQAPAYQLQTMDDDGILMMPGQFLLAETHECFGSDHYVPLIHGKSGTARLGLFVHITADLIDIGWVGNSTLQLFATLPVRIRPGMLIAQVSFWVPCGEIKLYRGKYLNSDGPQPSKIHMDLGSASWKEELR
jgi:dCTP deaminase